MFLPCVCGSEGLRALKEVLGKCLRVLKLFAVEIDSHFNVLYIVFCFIERYYFIYFVSLSVLPYEIRKKKILRFFITISRKGDLFLFVFIDF